MSHERIGGWAAGSYYITCVYCKETVPNCDKRAVSCRPCAEARDFCPHCGTTGWGADHAEDCPNNPVPGHGTGRINDLEIAGRLIAAEVSSGFRDDVARILGQQQDEVAWLIELPGGGCAPEWWSRVDKDGVCGWSGDHTKAVRFAREQDAKSIIDDMGWTEAVPTEHTWCEPRHQTQGSGK